MEDKELFGDETLNSVQAMPFPSRTTAAKLGQRQRRLFIGAYGFEARSMGWIRYQIGQGHILNSSLIFKYSYPKGRNQANQLRRELEKVGAPNPMEIPYNVRSPHKIEDLLSRRLESILSEVDEVVVDVSAMTKLLILALLCGLKEFTGTMRIVYSEAERYAPDEGEYQRSRNDMEMMAKFPSQGVESIIRLKCLSSIRMQGQPVTMIAFASFNEQLVRHMLGTISPHRLIFINGRPPREDFAWRERATQEIHKRLIEDYSLDNPLDEHELLCRAASTLEYNETVDRINEIYNLYGSYERIICAATGSKMQTVGLFFSKIIHPDIHIEYPTPDSYFVKGISEGIRTIHEIVIPRFSGFLEDLHQLPVSNHNNCTPLE